MVPYIQNDSSAIRNNSTVLYRIIVFSVICVV